MFAYKTSTDWTRNQNHEGIIYHDAFGNITDVTLEQFLAADSENTVEMFHAIKKMSDGIFEEEDADERRRSKKELPLYEWATEYATESLEEQLVERTAHEARKTYLRRRAELQSLLPEAMATLSENQRNRLLMHKVEGLTTREIAKRECVAQSAIVQSITGAEKKIQKFLRKRGFIS